jgi:preprotein translocase subunit SecF
MRRDPQNHKEKHMFKFVQRRIIWYSISLTLVVAAIVSIIVLHPKLGIDFTGGSLVELKFTTSVPEKSDMLKLFAEQGITDPLIQPAQGKSIIVRMPEIDQAKEKTLITAFVKKYPGTTEQSFQTIGPTLGNELKQKSILAIILVMIGMIAYISYAFRKISRVVPSWLYGVLAITALFHDVVITAGVYVVAGKFLGYEIDTLFITALLTVLGYSVTDTIVTYDRIRDNLLRDTHSTFEELVNNSINQTVIRSLNTSIVTFIALLAVYLFGGETTQHFVFTLMVGIFFGTYSSIFIASPLLVTAYKRWYMAK